MPPNPTGGSAHRAIDARSLRALAHPLRMRILELLSLDGPFTSTGLAKRLGENTGTVSWHLRHLAEHAFIEEDTERGTKRERWWRAVDQSTELDRYGLGNDPETQGAASVYLNEVVQELFSGVVTYLHDTWGEEWRGVGRLSRNTKLRLTPAQLAALNADLDEVIARHTPPPEAPPEPGSLPVVVQYQAFPRKQRGQDGAPAS
jgi:DNA-binding transcriptional ArsR family regulator